MTANSPPGVFAPIASAGALARLKKRADFVATSKGRRLNGRGFTLQMGERGFAIAPQTARIGLTVTKKTGNSVVRNRIRRRLREALRLTQSLSASPAHDYVLVARRELVSIHFAEICAGLETAFRKINLPRPSRGARTP